MLVGLGGHSLFSHLTFDPDRCDLVTENNISRRPIVSAVECCTDRITLTKPLRTTSSRVISRERSMKILVRWRVGSMGLAFW
jgi:hypothetical protein